MVDALFNFTTKLFNTNPPKLWPINTIRWCHSYLQKAYSFAMLIIQGKFNWLLHVISVESIFMCDWNISWSAHLWHYSNKLLHTAAPAALLMAISEFRKSRPFPLFKPSFLTPIFKNIAYFNKWGWFHSPCIIHYCVMFIFQEALKHHLKLANIQSLISQQIFYTIERWPYTYDMGITFAMPEAGGCLTAKNPM